MALSATPCSTQAQTLPAPNAALPLLTAPLAQPVWLCLPGATGNLCHQDIHGNRTDSGTPSSTYPQSGTTVPLNATVVDPDGTTATQGLAVTANPPVDCFYIYPTVDTVANPLLQIENFPPSPQDAEMATTLSQVGRLESICRLFVPLYRQEPLGTLAIQDTLGGLETYSGPGFYDVQQAFQYYWNNLNADPVTGKHRPFILLGHSQGSNALEAMMQTYLDGNANPNADVRRYMVSAVILGGLVQVPYGNPYGNDNSSTFATLPLCQRSSTAETIPYGCVIAYSSYPPGGPQSGSKNLAGNLTAGEQIACNNPQALLQGTSPGTNTVLNAYMGTETLFEGNSIDPSGPLLVTLLTTDLGDTTYPTGFTNYNDPVHWLSGECVQTGNSQNNVTYLEVDNYQVIESTQNIETKTKTAIDELLDSTGIVPDLGLHVADANLTEGSLLPLLQQQTAAWQAANP
ncbi:DUF3089 domain-containing protein [Dyella jejuensis]|uniref:DUF3089 domain-containing protein n=1 Tax=Dyella jejuensis TaxID=1432009 RepID=A0ABW8JG71_9GAMM